jgi:hypothetical protein
VFRGVYAVGHSALPPWGRTHAAVLACGPYALLSHGSAAHLWNLLRASRYVIDVTVPRRLGGQDGIKVHYAANLERAEVDGIPVTTVARTLLDLAATVSPRWLERAWDQAERRELLNLTELDEVLDRHRGHHGARALTALIAEERRAEPTRGELEDMLRDICKAYGLPIPAFNTSVAGEEVDAFWPPALVAELDGWQHHKTRRDRERDLLKEEKVKLAGYQFMRFSYRRLRDHPEEVAAVLSKCLDMASMLR